MKNRIEDVAPTAIPVLAPKSQIRPLTIPPPTVGFDIRLKARDTGLIPVLATMPNGT